MTAIVVGVGCLIGEGEYVRMGAPIGDGEQREGAVWLRSAVSGATGVEQHQAIVVGDVGDVAVAEDDDTGVGEFAARVAGMLEAFAKDVDEANHAAADDDLTLDGEGSDDIGLLDVALYRFDGGIGAELIEDGEGREVPRMEDALDGGEVAQDGVGDALGAAGDVRV